MKWKLHIICFVLTAIMLLMMPQGAWATTAYVSTYAELRDAISDASIDVIIVTANIDVPCGNSGNAGNTDLTGASTAQLIINRSLTLQSQAGSKYVIRRTSASGSTSTTLKSIFAIRGNGQGTSGTANLTENTIQVTFTNIIIDGGAVWGSSTVCERRNGAANAYGNAGRSMIDVYLGGVLNLEDGVEIRNGFTTKSDNSLLNDASTSQCFGGAVRVDYHNATGGGTINIKAGATIHDCTARGGYGGALGAYNYARLNLYGGTIYNCSANHGGAIACTYRSASGYGDATAGTIRMYGGTISNCCAENGGALCTHGPVEDYVLGGTITSCSATYGGAIYQAFSTTVIHIVDHNSGKLTISNCTNTHETPTENTDGYHFVYLSSGSINVTPVNQVTFRDNNTDFAVLSVAQGTSLGEAFPAAPVNASFRFVGWFNGDTQVTSTTVINSNITVTAKWDFLGSGTLASPYEIPSTDAWNFLADNVNNGNTYSGKYFQLTNDITVTTMVTATFSGTFDGGGHTLTFNYTATGNNAAPFAYITGATIKNLRVAGTINSGYKFAAGIVAISNGGSIENCRSSVTIDSSTSGDGTHGGLVADSYQGGLDINNCLFDGKLLGENTESCGGFVGWHKSGTLNISNSLFAPTQVTLKGGVIFARNSATALDNCYYISDWAAATVQGTNANSMTAAALVTALNNGDKNWCIYRGNAIPIMVNLVISTKAQWDTFAANVGNYDGKYVQLSANIGTANAPITTMTTTDPSFKGIFDGNGHTLTVNLTNSGGNLAPFRYLYGGTIMNLTVTGTVTGGANYCSGLVARTSGSDNLIDNCVVNTNVAGTEYVAGIVAHGDNATKLAITNCIYGGTITQSSGFSGGILGWYNNDKTLDLIMTNCLFKGDYTGNGQFHPIGVKKWAGIFKSINCTNCYYTKNPANIDGPDRFFTDGTKVSELTIGTTGVSIASGSYATFQGTKYYYGTVTLGYNGPMATTNFSLDGTHLNDNSFTISKDNAAFDDGTATIKWDFPGRGTEEEPYLIPSTEVWNYLADQVNGGTNYSGKYFQQTGDFTVSSKIIGYPTDDTHYVTFNGIYDGNERTITASISKSDERYVAPFHCIADATIKNVIVTGSVTVSGSASIERRRHPAGLVGVTDGTCILQNCRVSANVSGCDYMGGLIGHTQNANITITGCVYSGILTASDANNTGGLIGWGGDNGGKTYALSNNLFAGSYSGSGKFHPVGFLYNPTGNTRTVTNTYYMAGLQKVSDDDGNSLVNGLSYKGKFAYSITGGTGVTVSNAGTPTTYYNVSDITSYGIGIKYGEVLYGGNGDVVSLNLGYTPQSGYSFHSFTASAGTLTGSSNPYTLTMTNDNATISARYSAAINIAATTTNAKDGWYLIASPMGTVSPTSVTNLLSNDYDLFRFNQSAEIEWQNYTVHNNDPQNPFNALISGQGYLYANSSNVTLTFIGTPYSGTGEFALEYSTSNPDTRMRGWNLIGNPFGVTATITRPCYKMKDTHDGVILHNGSELSPVTVNPMEGVFVYAATDGETVTFTPSGSKRGENNENNIVINLSDNKGTIIDRAIVSFDEGRTLPKFQIKDNSTKLYIPQNGVDYAIAFSYRIGELPLNFKAQETGVYTLNFNGDNMTAVSLVDMIEGAIIDLSVNDTYTFIGTSADRADRFKLVFSSPNDSNIEIFAYQTGNDIVVSGEGELQVFDVMGRMVISQRINGVQTVTQPLQTGVYIFRLNEKSQKIVVR